VDLFALLATSVPRFLTALVQTIEAKSIGDFIRFVRSQRTFPVGNYAYPCQPRCVGVFSLLNQAVRYFPILRVLKRQQVGCEPSILEVGAGPTGLGQFQKQRFIGVDTSFPSRPSLPMIPVVASALALPFANRAFDVVVASDVLEHIPEVQREALIREVLRVTGKLAVFGFPSGDPAHKCDEALRDIYVRRNLSLPTWLQEHMLEPFPETDLFRTLPGWHVSITGNENLDIQLAIMRLEMHTLFNYAMKAAISVLPRLLEAILRRFDRPPFYRQIVVLSRVDEKGP
jgi:hypothetical protein